MLPRFHFLVVNCRLDLRQKNTENIFVIEWINKRHFILSYQKNIDSYLQKSVNETSLKSSTTTATQISFDKLQSDRSIQKQWHQQQSNIIFNICLVLAELTDNMNVKLLGNIQKVKEEESKANSLPRVNKLVMSYNEFFSVVDVVVFVVVESWNWITREKLKKS